MPCPGWGTYQYLLPWQQKNIFRQKGNYFACVTTRYVYWRNVLINFSVYVDRRQIAIYDPFFLSYMLKLIKYRCCHNIRFPWQQPSNPSFNASNAEYTYLRYDTSMKSDHISTLT